ncbi:MAG: MBOAT family protein, partial [Clostridia bacterium]|nr:MBOAT family protein [Clostridia bacterium]
MVFSTPFFIFLFLALLFPCYYLLKSTAARKAVLVAFSLIFYAFGEPVLIALMLLMIAVNYLGGLLVASCRTLRGARAWLIVSVAVDLGILCVFKYSGLFVETLNSVFHIGIPVPSVRMPIGISFYTFQAMSYVIDVYRGDVRPQRKIFNLLLYVSFFAQLIAGPIVRYKDIESQLDDRRVRLYDLNDGVFRFSVGLAKKIVIADQCAVAINALYGISNVTFAARWAGAFFYALQIYFDFSGYSDMAIGL